jgi:hypothetical protein
MVIYTLNQRNDAAAKKKDEPEEKSMWRPAWMTGVGKAQNPALEVSPAVSEKPGSTSAETAQPTKINGEVKSSKVGPSVAQQLERLEIQLLRLRRAERELKLQVDSPKRALEVKDINQKLNKIKTGKGAVKKRICDLRAQSE